MKYINGVIFSLFFTFVFPAFAFADESLDLCPKDSAFFKLCGITGSGGGFSKILGTAISILLIAAVVISLFFLIWGGIKWSLSGGDKAGVEAARNTIIAAIIGLVVALAAYFILNIVLGFFNIKLTDIKLPSFVQ
jgi:multisubunit Na+/H+ antiporter MnhB subunit